MAIISSLQNQTVTVDVNITKIMEAAGINIPIPQKYQEEDITFNLGNVSYDTVYTLVNQYLLNNWDQVESLFSPENYHIECTVVDGLDDPYGKWPKSLGNVAILESKYLITMIQKLIPKNALIQNFIAISLGLKDPSDTSNFNLVEYIGNIQINDYAILVIAQYRDRFETYVKDTDGMDHDLTLFSNDVSEALGITYPADLELPIEEILVGLNYLRIFLNQIFNTVLIILVGLGIMLIYSLLLSDVEDKTYEFGMLRALGLEKTSLILLLIIQSIFYSVPGIVISLICAYLGGIPIIYAICFYSTTTPVYTLSYGVILLGVCVGIFIPIISNIFPIKRALSRTLRDSLDVYHHTSQEIEVKVVRLESLGLDPWQISCAILMVVTGFTIYYVVPLSFVFANIPLFLTILNLILLGMLFGASIIAAIFQPILERQLLHLFLWGSERNLYNLIKKSLSGHRNRNRKTALMFTTCVAFIIFSAAMFTLQTEAIVDNVKAGIGADIEVISYLKDNPLNEDEMIQFLDDQLNRPEEEKILLSYTFISYAMWDYDEVKRTVVSNLADFPEHTLFAYGLEKNFLDTAFSEYFIPSEYDKSFKYSGVPEDFSKPDVIRSLYDDAGKEILPIETVVTSIPPNILSAETVDGTSYYYRSSNQSYLNYVDVLASESLRYASYVDVKSPLSMDIYAQMSNYKQFHTTYLLKMRAMITKLPAFFFSSYRQLAYGSPLILTMDSFQKLIDNIYETRKKGDIENGKTEEEAEAAIAGYPKTPPKQRLLMKLKPNPTIYEREEIMNGLRNFIDNDLTIILDTIDILSTTDVATSILLLFFDIVAAISCILCFFVLWLSFTSNIHENSWEFGVLRAIGLNSGQVIRIYVYEALCIIFSALFLGSLSGILIAVTLTLQFNLFTEMPFHFDFPYLLFISVIIMSLLVAVGGSYLAARGIKNKEIAHVLKGTL